MDDEFDGTLCEICFLIYNKTNNLPKIIECCKHTFCLECLIKIYNKNNNRLMCSICRNFTDKNPNELATDLDKFPENKPKCLKCPKCKKECTVDNLFVNINNKNTNDSNGFILCKDCIFSEISNNEKNNNNKLINTINIENNFTDYYIDNINLNEFFENMKIELQFFNEGNIKNLDFTNNESDKTSKRIEESLDSKIMNFIDVFFERLKRNIKIKTKKFISEYLSEEFDLNISAERDLNSFIYQYQKDLKNVLDKINNFYTVSAENIDTINNSISIYMKINNVESIIDKIIHVKNFIKNLTLNFAITNNENFENMFVDNIELKQNNELFFSNIINYSMKNSDKDFISGFSLIDEEFHKLKIKHKNTQEELLEKITHIENLNVNILNKENQINDLSNRVAEVLNEINDLEQINEKLEKEV